ncbi:MAG: hypothetical protein RLZZ29_689 [Cyanobacteriota bacterium]|jgi:hypothetical protein
MTDKSSEQTELVLILLKCAQHHHQISNLPLYQLRTVAVIIGKKAGRVNKFYFVIQINHSSIIPFVASL